ncbi:methyltransferase domain-containing protein [Catellatospora coxensis]
MTIADESPYDAVAEQYNERSEKHRANVSLWVDRLIRHVGANFSALDIGCGVGLSISILTHNGIRAAGIDASHKMVEFARARNPDVEIKHGNIFWRSQRIPSTSCGSRRSSICSLRPKPTQRLRIC